jgi:hypothetical protein
MRTIRQKPKSLPARQFAGRKCASPITVHCALEYDFLTQASLDASVFLIDFVSSYNVAGHAISLDIIVIHQSGCAYAADFPEIREVRDVDDEGLALIALSELGLELISVRAADVELEPRCSNAREVWRHRNLRVPADICANVVASVEAQGELSLRQLAKVIDSRFPMPSTVYALACGGVVDLDLKQKRLGPGTIATRGYLKTEHVGSTTKSTGRHREPI